MTYKTVDRMKANGTSYQGLFKARYSELVAMFGEPNGPSGDGKQQVQWTLEIAGGVIATIYDYKEDQPARSLLMWHVGGKTKDVVQLLEIIAKEKRREWKKENEN